MMTIPSFLEGLSEFDGEPILGWRPITRDMSTTPPCDCGMLAPGSSPHWHTAVTGYMVVTPTTIIEFDEDGMPMKASMLYPADA